MTTLTEDTTDIELTPEEGTFVSGTVEAVVYYWVFEEVTSV